LRNFFYARGSSKNQFIERQIAAARELGIEEEYIFIEKTSRKDFKRPEYQLMKRMFKMEMFYTFNPWID
jgi:DNA invertase Pin-like site-specific DNA recombinase